LKKAHSKEWAFLRFWVLKIT